jgi:hypothetical protein
MTTATDNQKQGTPPVHSDALLSGISFKQALKKLNIEDYGERIFNSNSHGELMHLMDYIHFATVLDDEGVKWFRPMFVVCVEWAEKNWQRPESCFQWMPKLMQQMAEAMKPDNDQAERLT